MTSRTRLTWRTPAFVEIGARKDLEQAIRRFEDTLAGIPANEIPAALSGEATEAIKARDALMLGLCLERLQVVPRSLIDEIAQLLLGLHRLGQRLEFDPRSAGNPTDPDETALEELRLAFAIEGIKLTSEPEGRGRPSLKKAIDLVGVSRSKAERALRRRRQWLRDAAYLRSKP